MQQLTIAYSGFRGLMYIWVIIAVVVFFVLLRITAPYGRHNSEKWGPVMSNRWGWLIMESPVLIVMGTCLLRFDHSMNLLSRIMVGLFFIHYVNRCFIFPFRLHTKGKTIPVLIVASAILFNLVNGFSLGYYFTHYANYSNAWLSDPRFIAGLILFFTGMYINWRADDVLIHLRKPGETGYVVPQGWLFNYISCPNLLGELIEWLGFAILCWNLPAFCFFIWTAANLIPRGISHHKWYQTKFADYPASRFAVIPFFI